MSEEPGPCPAGRHDDDPLRIGAGRAGNTGDGLQFHRLTDDEFVELYERLAPHAKRYVRSFGRIGDADADDIFQSAWLLFDQARKRKRIHDPRYYFFGILRRAVYSHLRKAAQLPAPLPHPTLLPDCRAYPPDQVAAENEERRLNGRREARAVALVKRVHRRLIRLRQDSLELKFLMRERPAGGADQPDPAKRGPGRPKKGRAFRRFIDEELPKITSHLLKYFPEPEKGT